MTDRIEALARLLEKVHRDMFELTRGIIRHSEVSPPGMGILVQTVATPGSTVSDIARRTGIAKSHVSNTVEHLAGCGFVEKRSDPDDQRLVRIYPTAKAKSHLNLVHEAVRRRLSAALAALPEDRIEDIIGGLETLQATLDNAKSGVNSSCGGQE